ncbi:MAG: efflux RND transporter permease subunit, partial [Acidaminobacteraceae bacterium]
ASEGTNQVAFPIFAATLTTIAAFFPLAILPGILGDFISTIPLTIIITLLVSFLVSIVVTPTISARILKKSEKTKELSKTMKIVEIAVSLAFVSLLSFYAFSDKGNNIKTGIGAAIIFSILIGAKEYRAFFNKKTGVMLNRYGSFIEGVVKSKAKKALILTLGLVVLLGSFVTFSTGALKVAFFPTNEPNSVTIEIDTPGGSTLEETALITESVENILKENKDIAQFNTTIGGSEIDKAIINVSLLANDELSGSGFEVVDQIEKELYNVAGAEIIIKGVASGPPIGSPISIKLIGDNLEELNSATSSYTEILKSIGGVYNVNSSIKNGVPQIIIDVNENKALMYGLSVSDITNQVRSQIAGIKTSVLNENREEVNIVIRKDEVNMNDISEINNMYIVSKSGAMIPLNFLATLREFSSISSINHEESERIVTIEADLKQGFNVNDIVSEFKESVKSVLVSDAIEIQYSGDIEGITENFIYLFQSMILAVFLVFIILTIQFKSIAQPFAILSTVPMAIIGVIWGLIITSNDFGFYSFMGLVALVGIAVNDAIVLIDYMNYLRLNGSSLNEAIKEATLTRFNPVLATTMTTIGGVLPLAFKEVYYAEFSFSLIFGLLVTTVLTLVFIPIMYSIIENIKLKIGLSNNSTSRV